MGMRSCRIIKKRLQNIADNTDRNAHNLYLNHTQATPNAECVDYEGEETDCSSDISEALLTCETLPVTTFEVIDGELPTTDRRDLSKDQMYLLEISQVLRLGNCSDELARRSPGSLSHSRWLTTANRVLRLYVTSPACSLKLKQIAAFFMKVYTPNWFNVKSKHSLKD
ncbi:hypothetical protein AVEN_142418-1 [Araneus ventricosus]|uniref:Uncharacterized protein n=1 Tax=Araneus ventricosus TaxID=182803 RepID=A0A4Y2VDZ5_ARAVE|nr:hypothetical protein AVEN_256334-1 [Araneus ventricosus]GBO21900.1 hypothetical protein AVEN_142418-1 [Araneus ventricosus]